MSSNALFQQSIASDSVDPDGTGLGLHQIVDVEPETQQHMVLPLSLKKRQNQHGTLSQPSRDESIMCCSKVLHRHIVRRDFVASPATEQSLFDIEHYLSKTYHVMMPTMVRTHPFTAFHQQPKAHVVPTPDVDKIYRFIKRLFDRAHLNAECVIIALIYIERLMEMTNLHLGARNWIPIVMTALLTASKVWDDHSSFNAEFSSILPMFTLRDINALERQFLTQLNYILYISSSDYARYYFGLRALRKKAIANIPRYYLKIGIGSSRKIQSQSRQSEVLARGVDSDDAAAASSL